MDLNELNRSPVDQRVKGMPGGLAPLALEAIGAQGWNLLREDLPLPVAVLRQHALSANRRWMQAFLRQSGAVIAPHGKTTMAPQLFETQLDDGAWAITVGTVHQLQVARAYGVDRVILANQLVGRQAMRYVLDELARDPDFDFYCLVDSAENVGQLAAAARQAELGRPLQLLLEGGYQGGRTGCRDLASALSVARMVADAAPALSLRGVEGFEGLFPGSAEAKAAAVAGFLDFLVEIAVAVERAGFFGPGPVLLSAGGSAFYDMVAARFARARLARDVKVVMRSGCYLTHDSGLYAHAFDDLLRRSPELGRLNAAPEPALEVWAYVQSRPEAGKVLLTMGKRDVSHDEMPRPLRWFRPGGSGRTPAVLEAGHVVTGLNDQHCHMTVPASSPLAVGDMVAFGISHPCLTFDKWQVIPVVDDAYDIVGAVRTFF